MAPAIKPQAKGIAKMKLSTWRSRLLAAGFAVAALALAGCDDEMDSNGGRSLAAIPQTTLTLMDNIGTTASSPVLFRAYKKEAVFEIWKQKSDGQYALLKSYPMCRWSGQLGPKKREGDRQVPEGFYTIAPGQMNPNSHYYLSFNVGYPNAYDRAWDHGGGSIMVHGICSSAGCFSMTDPQIEEIYAIARESFNAGQREIQFQSYPFRMTAENLAKERLDPNIAFWKELKNGYDHFQVTKQEVPVVVCDRRYVFGAKAQGEVSGRGACPRLIRDNSTEADVAALERKDDTQVAALVAKGVKPVRLVYSDGGQNAYFANKGLDESRPDALADGPREIVLGNDGKPLPAVVMVASAASAKSAMSSKRGRKGVKAAPAPEATTVIAAAPASKDGLLESGKSLMNKLFRTAADTPPAPPVFEPQSPIPANAPLPPRRAASLNAPVRMAALHEETRKRQDANTQ
jgi:murein L,D-transpeptidase YafK